MKLPLQGISVEITCDCGERTWIAYDPSENIHNTTCKMCQRDHMDIIIMIKENWER